LAFLTIHQWSHPLADLLTKVEGNHFTPLLIGKASKLGAPPYVDRRGLRLVRDYYCCVLLHKGFLKPVVLVVMHYLSLSRFNNISLKIYFLLRGLSCKGN